MNQERNDKIEGPLTVFLMGKISILRPLGEEGDLERCYRWINDPDVSRFLKNRFPITLFQEKKWMEGDSSKKDSVSLALTTLDGVHIGNMGVHKIDWVNRVATTGAVIGEKEYWGKGYGTDAKMQLLNYLFNTLNLRKICSAAYAFNKRSVAYSLKCGYKIEGVRKKHVFRDGKFHDVVDLAVFKEDWLPVWKKYNSRKK